MNSIWDYLPQFFWLGPPLPRFMNILWPSIPSSELPNLPSFLPPASPAQEPKSFTTYDNEETVEFPDGFDPVTCMPYKIVVHRSAKVT